ncbi:hypothetical protein CHINAEXTREME_18075 [Halobiforma lacisalsi AJ5]|uniref:Uncharacterized protein n=1 Tax=Natronobacterium lacisalsi AJ5 TaxID=358396 RepID=A0A1P8LUT6_NATLA|nr:hypothetical protein CHINAEXTREME_18075 [Halobiforma lacisalsi AJ5]
MFSLASSVAFVVLHTSHGAEVTFTEYLFRVLASLLFFGALGVTAFWTVRALGVVYSGLRRRRASRRAAERRSRR